ncbi:Gfo/Idh/MocA family protein [Aeoliella sp. SH292]|uniref:Gfo/Idh/MocA family protein n=1 Tax=Aeoliella sp. SH292 TaxID=3454464 RepID=UPI003F9956CC
MTMGRTRRDFLRTTSHTAAVLAAASLGQVHAAGNEKSGPLKIALIGCGGIMNTHVKTLLQMPKEATVTWLCDVDPQNTKEKLDRLNRSSGAKPRVTQHAEDIFNDSTVDACVIATPNHWHAPLAIAAMRAGKDVYLEKPASHCFTEGPLLIETAEKYGRVVQHGTQMRSSPVYDQAAKVLADGILGEIKFARAWSAEVRPASILVPDSTPPKGVDYDRWLGPAPVHAFNVNRFHKKWRLYPEYANGDIGDDGVHELDLGAWGLGMKGDVLPTRVTSHGGHLFPPYATEFFDDMTVTYEFPTGQQLIYEMHSVTPYGLFGVDNGNVFYGTEGYMLFSRRGFFNVYLGPKGTPGPKEDKAIRGQRGYLEHMRDFLQAIRQRTPTRAPLEVGHRSSALVHLANIAAMTRGALEFDTNAGKFRDCDEANTMLTKNYRAPYGV